MKLWIASAALVAALLGCESGPKIVTPPPPSKANVIHPDLPVPLNFTYAENLTDSSPTGSFRVINQTIHGPNMRVDGAAKFYRDTLPGQGWTLESEDAPRNGPVRQAWTKKGERCRIEINDPQRTVVVVSLKVNRKD